MRKRWVIVMLIGFNLALLAGLILSTYSLPAAYAQSGGRKGDFTCVTAKAAGRTYDVLYVLDASGHKLYAFYPSSAPRGPLTWSAPRDLKADFEAD